MSRGRLDLGRPRDLGDLLGTALQLFFSHFGVALSLALIAVAPVTILADGVWGGRLAEGGEADPGLEAVLGSAFAHLVIVTPLVTALLVRAVLDISRGEEPTVGGVVREAGPVIVPALATVLLYAAGTALGFAVLILPGIWLSVRWYVAPQATIVEGLAPVAALRRSASLVEGQWWRVFGLLIVFGLVSGIVGGILSIPAQAVDDGVVSTVLVTVGDAVATALSAIAGTLLYFDLRARRDAPAAVDGFAPPTPEAPA